MRFVPSINRNACRDALRAKNGRSKDFCCTSSQVDHGPEVKD
jgi:hypothetical protein